MKTEPIPEPAKTLKLYYPVEVTAWMYTYDVYGSPMDLTDNDMDACEAAEHLDAILGQVEKEILDNEAERGLMTYYSDEDTVNSKVLCARPGAVVLDGELFGVTECTLAEDLVPEELEKLKEYITGQLSDGYGEGFEQRDIEVDDPAIKSINVHFYDSSRHWGIRTQDEMPQPAEGPEPAMSL